MTKTKCEWRRFPVGGGFDVFQVCDTNPFDIATKKPVFHRGNVLGAFVCLIRGIGHEGGCRYNWNNGQCRCSGVFRPIPRMR